MAKGKVLVLRHGEKILTILTEGNRFLSVNACSEAAETLVGNIYIGKVKNIVANIQAAFVEIKSGLLCYLPLSDVVDPVMPSNRGWNGKLKVGDELLVQVERDALKTKPPAVTTRISLAGQYMVLTLDSKTACKTPGKVGISAKLSAEQKKRISDALCQGAVTTEAGYINEPRQLPVKSRDGSSFLPGAVIRTNAVTLAQTDYAPLIGEWQQLTAEIEELLSVAPYRPVFYCLRSAPAGYLNTLQGIYLEAYDEIITDAPDLYEAIKIQISRNQWVSDNSSVPTVRLYRDTLLPLSKLYSVDSRLKEALQPRVWLKSGGYLVIEPTEALTVIDVNSGKYEAKRGAEETFLKINLEAAQEIALQLQLRNLSGIIIVDFITMESEEKNHCLLQELRRFVKTDPVQTNVIDMTALGLVEITRKKIHKSLWEQLDA